jgi:hypothetical protein
VVEKRTVFLTMTFCILFFQVVRFHECVAGEADTRKEPSSSSSPFDFGVKGCFHSFWSKSLSQNGENTGGPGLSAGDFNGLGGEADLDYFYSRYWVFTLTAGMYEGSEHEKDVSIITGYGLLTAKLQKPGELADYYIGAGVGGYIGRIEAGDTAYSLKPGIHALIGIRIHVNSDWSILLEDRPAFSLNAQGRFGGLNLGGNFVLLGCSYRF